MTLIRQMFRRTQTTQVGSPQAIKILLDLQGLQSKSRERGIGRLTRSLAHSMIDQAGQHEVHVLLSEDLDEVFEEIYREFSTRLPPDRLHTFGPYGGVSERNPDAKWRARAAAFLREAQIAKLRPDIVHVGSLFEGFVDGAVTSIGRLEAPHASAVTLYDLIPFADPDRYLADPMYRNYYLRHVQDLKRADVLLAISDYSRTDAAKRLQIPLERIAVIFAGVDQRFRPTIVDEKTQARLRHRLGTTGQFLFYVGAADPRKNVSLILEAFMLLPPRQQSNLSVVFAGQLSDYERNQVLTAGRQVGIPDHKIVLLGLVDDSDLIALYSMCAALVFPSTNEGFGLPPLEAMACGVPALVADATSLPEVVGRSDCLFDPHSAASLTKCIVRLLSDSDWRLELCQWGPKRAANFTWAAAGRRALDAFEAAVPVPRHTERMTPLFRRRPRMAFMSPLPPDKSGIADYSAELLREFLIYYEIDCIHPQATTDDHWIQANCGLRDMEWFEAHADLYDRIVYSIGNSTFHTHMFASLARHPGTVILHDAFLSDLAVDRLEGARKPTDAFAKEIYASHGLTGLRHMVDQGMGSVVADLTMSGNVFRNAQGVIVHSRFAKKFAEAVFGESVEQAVAIVPLMRAEASNDCRAAARIALELDHDAFVVCCFGSVHPRKMNRLAAEAFLTSVLARDPVSYLAFVGDASPPYEVEIRKLLDAASPTPNVRFVGRADDKLYALYLQAADVALQLRTESRGETSKATLDAMAHGLAVIVSDIGAASELPDDTVLKVPSSVTSETLATMLGHLRNDPAFKTALGERARDEIRRQYHPFKVGRQIRDLVEQFAVCSPRVEEQTLISAIADLPTERAIHRTDVQWVASQVKALLPPPRQRQIFCDVSAIARTDLRTGIERVVRAVLERLILAPPQGFRIEPTIIENGSPVYARAFVEERLGLPMGGARSDPVEIEHGDHYLAVDWAPNRVTEIDGWLDLFRRRGGCVTFVVYDLLPLEAPAYFPDWLTEVSSRWLDLIVRKADNIACISKVVADSVIRLGEKSLAERQSPLSVGFFHLGCDFAASKPTTGMPPDADIILASLRARPSFLVLGTVEPRKGHSQLLAAFEELWADGLNVGLTIVGKKGWMVDELTAAIEISRYVGTKLIWLSSASDEFIEEIFSASIALVVPSFGEGFGLPIIEAADHGLPVIARNLPVFREIADDHAFYFDGSQAADLAQALRTWLDLHARKQEPSSSGIVRLRWAQSTEQLLEIMFGSRNYRALVAPTPPAVKA